jgi:hypothetical protein
VVVVQYEIVRLKTEARNVPLSVPVSECASVCVGWGGYLHRALADKQDDAVPILKRQRVRCALVRNHHIPQVDG